MSEQDKKIEDKNLEKVVGGKSYWSGPEVLFSSEEGDWHAGDKFIRNSPIFSTEMEHLVLQDNGTYIDKTYGHQYNAKRYRLNGEFMGDTTITDYAIMRCDRGIQFICHIDI